MRISINTKFGLYVSESVDLSVLKKKINVDVASRNVLDLNDFFSSNNFRYGVIYGTLLGLYRDRCLIPWDEDTDIFIMSDHKNELINSLFELRDIGFEVVRNDGDLISLMRDGEYTDLYFFNCNRKGYCTCNLDKLPSHFFSSTSFVELNGISVPTVSNIEEFLRYSYGEDWCTPKDNSPADVKGRLGSLYVYIRPIVPKNVVKLAKAILYKHQY